MSRIPVILLLAVIVVPENALAQQQLDPDLDLATAYESAIANAPRLSDAARQQSMSDLRQQNLRANYLPAISVSGQAVYYSEVAEFPFSIPGQETPTVANDQYRIGVNVDQLIYDGGATATQSSLEEARSGYARQEVAVSIYSVRQQVEDAFFGVLLADAVTASIRVRISDLRARLDEVNALVDEGVLVASSSDQVLAELLRLQQEESTSVSRALAARDILATLIGMDIPDTVELELPVYSSPDYESESVRPELKQFDLARQVLDRQTELATSTRRPRLSSFGEVAYGRSPGLNLFENDFKPFVSAGLRMKWPAWDWKRSHREQQILQIQKELIDSKQEQFEQSIAISVARKRREIERLKIALQTDIDVIDLRHRILEDTASRLQAGLATATDLIRETNALETARLSRNVHTVELAYASAQLITIRGTE